ncbi:MAG: peptidoglycan-binding protein [Verrucomicrobiota bacterium]|nr:peptidoglycan-binding protein [Verrucomicrobiota bacterium]
MKRLIFLFFSLVLCGAGNLRADENTRALQSRLKDGGFYFGDVNGEYSSQTAAAVTRYQIRNGLEISGKLDAATAKSLGVATAPAGATVPPENSETWRQLRKPDRQFLERMAATESPSPAPRQAKTIAPPVGQGAPLAPAETLNSEADHAQTFVLSRERLRDYVAAFVLAGIDSHVGAELDFFADRVSYFNEGIVGRDRIQRDLQTYDRRWPQRRFWLAGQVEVEPRPDSRLRVTFPLRYELRNGSKHSSGKVRKTLVVEVTGEDLQIVGVDESKADQR